ncbi:hypothetical protein BamMEX5DRAFT_6233 [Burkholderia ambifaria MEX-5]|uniref:Uncharacterized protein n=1 Tax=Burkholderia ambifaria MEX-5 TaxID=396597 RepID=B1TEL7_9BURK|nr:hypothetical protein BamMEX5DRAFT_6233 [Burkholderia ambifaria MEX-5]
MPQNSPGRNNGHRLDLYQVFWLCERLDTNPGRCWRISISKNFDQNFGNEAGILSCLEIWNIETQDLDILRRSSCGFNSNENLLECLPKLTFKPLRVLISISVPSHLTSDIHNPPGLGDNYL